MPRVITHFMSAGVTLCYTWTLEWTRPTEAFLCVCVWGGGEKLAPHQDALLDIKYTVDWDSLEEMRDGGKEWGGEMREGEERPMDTLICAGPFLNLKKTWAAPKNWKCLRIKGLVFFLMECHNFFVLNDKTTQIKPENSRIWPVYDVLGLAKSILGGLCKFWSEFVFFSPATWFSNKCVTRCIFSLHKFVAEWETGI